MKGRFAANNGAYHRDLNLVLHIRHFSDKIGYCEYLHGKFHFLNDVHYYLKKCFAQKKKIVLNTENHILKSIQLLLVCSLSTFNSLLPEELIKWTIDPYNLCTFIKSTPALQCIQLTMPVSLEFPTTWMGLECISRHVGSVLLQGPGTVLSWTKWKCFFRLNKSNSHKLYLTLWMVLPFVPLTFTHKCPFSPGVC